MEQIKQTLQTSQTGPDTAVQFYVDGDINIPEVKADAARVVCADGAVHVEEIRPAERSLRVAGQLFYQVLYETEDGGLAALAGRLPFEETAAAGADPADAFYVRRASAELAAGLINSRKVNLRVSVDLEAGAQRDGEVQITADLEGDAPLCRKQASKEILTRAGACRDICRIREEVQLPAAKESIGTVLLAEADLRKLDTRLEEGTLVLRGELQVFILYETETMKTEWLEQAVPFEGKLDAGGAGEDLYHCVHACLGETAIEARLDEDGELRIFGVEAALEVRCCIYREETVRILEDAYSPGRNLLLEREDLELESLVMLNNSRCRLTERLTLPEIQDGTLQILKSSGYPQLEPPRIKEGEIQVEGALSVSFLYVRADDDRPFGTWQGMVPFSQVIECPGASPAMRCDIGAGLEQLSVSLLGSGEAEVKAALSFRLFLRRPEKIRNITSVQEQSVDPKELESAPGIIGCIVREGDTLWDIARRYGATEEGIREANGLKEGEPKTGDKLLIFKENMGIL